MDIRLETPTSPLQCRQWTEIMERVSGDVFGVEELARRLRRRGARARHRDRPRERLAARPGAGSAGPWRRRGIATALKRAQIERARAAGIEQIFTSNDETNVAMRGVNAGLGYRPEPVKVLVSGPLSGAE